MNNGYREIIDSTIALFGTVIAAPVEGGAGAAFCGGGEGAAGGATFSSGFSILGETSVFTGGGGKGGFDGSIFGVSGLAC